MINKEEHYVAWALHLTELDDAYKHLEVLIRKMTGADAIQDSEFAIDLGHVYAHLNRAWHLRNQRSEITNDQWSAFSQFPKDLEPVG